MAAGLGLEPSHPVLETSALANILTRIVAMAYIYEKLIAKTSNSLCFPKLINSTLFFPFSWRKLIHSRIALRDTLGGPGELRYLDLLVNSQLLCL